MYIYIKRIFDIVGAFFLLIIFLPIMILIGLAIKIDSPGPFIFKQNRVGKDGKKFYIYKFRTMKIDTPKDIPTHLFNDSVAYMTNTGKFLRKTSLDELPQLFNILQGNMSFIGPRPALWNQFDLIRMREKFGVNKICPGLTGLAQINGRDELSINQKVYYDYEYGRKISFSLDIKIFFHTIKKVMFAEGVKNGQ